jgi:hypothetical protein
LYDCIIGGEMAEFELPGKLVLLWALSGLGEALRTDRAADGTNCFEGCGTSAAVAALSSSATTAGDCDGRRTGKS